MTRVGILGDPDDVLWDGTGLRESESVRPPRNLLRRAGFEVVRGAAPGEVAGVILLVTEDGLERLAWWLALARRRGFDRLVVLRWEHDEDVGARLRAGGFDPAACPVVDAVIEEEGDPEWGTQFDVLDARSTKQLVAALHEVCVDAPPPTRALGGCLDELFAKIEAHAATRGALPVARGQLTAEAAWRLTARSGAIAGTLVDAEPYVEEGEAWPACAVCGEAMATVFQIDPADGLDGERFPGLFVAFACFDGAAHVSTAVRYYREPRVERRRKLRLPSAARGRLGYALARGRRELVPRAWAALPAEVQDAFAAPLDGLAGEALYAELAPLVAARASCDAHAGDGVAAPACARCGGPCACVFATTYLAGIEHAFELWACPCAPASASLVLVAHDASSA